MTDRVKALVEEARKLTPDEQDELLRALLAEIDGPADGSPEEIEAAWAEEIEQRVARAERGETNYVPAEEVLSKARALLKRL